MCKQCEKGIIELWQKEPYGDIYVDVTGGFGYCDCWRGRWQFFKEQTCPEIFWRTHHATLGKVRRVIVRRYGKPVFDDMWGAGYNWRGNDYWPID